jgi:hypothetical protein
LAVQGSGWWFPSDSGFSTSAIVHLTNAAPGIDCNFIMVDGLKCTLPVDPKVGFPTNHDLLPAQFFRTNSGMQMPKNSLFW